MQSAAEFLRPGSSRRPTIAPFEAGLRPNDDIDGATVMLEGSLDAADDIVIAQDCVVVSDDRRLHFLRPDDSRVIRSETLPGRITALCAIAGSVCTAVEGIGLVRVNPDGHVQTVSDRPELRSGVTAIAGGADNEVIAAVGSMEAKSWAHALMAGDRSGAVFRVSAGGELNTVIEAVAWPSGLAVDGDVLLVSLSLAHRIERRPLESPATPLEPLLDRLPGYPGRLTPAVDGGWWVAVPRVRNRGVELLLRDRDLVHEMVSSLDPDAWLVPRLSADVDHVAPVQVGQVRVLGTIKPWAPPLSYGLAIRSDGNGHVLGSVHARAGSSRHGITGIATLGPQLFMASAGARAILQMGGHNR